MRKAEEDYLAAAAAAAATTTATSQPQAAGVKSKLQGRRSPSRGTVSATRGGASRRKRPTGGRGGRADIHDSESGGDGDADALACIGERFVFVRPICFLRPSVLCPSYFGGTILNRTYGTQQKPTRYQVCISLFLLTVFGSFYYGL